MQNENTPTEGQNSDKLEAESALRDAACCASSIPFGTDLTNVAEENSKAVDELLATSQFLVDVGHDPIPSERLKEGCPVGRANESVGGTRPPNGNDCPSKTRAMCAPLQGGDGVVLVGGGLRAEGLCEGVWVESADRSAPPDAPAKWKIERIDWHAKGRCWSWLKIRKSVYYSGNQVQWTWGRIACVFERRTWIHPENADVDAPAHD